MRRQIRAIVRDPAVAEKLLPTSYPIGTKRICADTNYYETFNRANVTLVDLRASPITGITPGGIATRDAEYAVDSIVYATGFDAMTGSLLRVNISGRGGMPLAQKWADGPRSYLGLMTAGSPTCSRSPGRAAPPCSAT